MFIGNQLYYGAKYNEVHSRYQHHDQALHVTFLLGLNVTIEIIYIGKIKWLMDEEF